MPILLTIFGLLVAGAVWYYRLKMLGDAASEINNQVGKVQGHFRRQKLRKKSAMAPVTAIDDPVTAAATVMLSIASEDKLVTEELEARIRDAVEPISANEDKLVEAVTYAKWANNQVADVTTVIDQTSKFLVDKLNEDEKEQLVAMVQSVVLKAERHPLYGQRIDRLRRKLGLVGTQ